MRLFAARGREAAAVCRQADELRREVNGERVAYVVNRNINYTNVCYFRCRFCAFSKGKLAEHLRGPAYDLDLDEIARRTREAWQRGATEMCLQGGIHPDYTGATYLEICRTVKEAAPEIHVHAFSPLEVWQGARTLGIPLGEFLAELQARRARLAARHRRRDPRRRGAPGDLPGQDHDRAVARGHAHRPCAGPAQHRDRSCSATSTIRATGRGTCCASATLQAETGGFTEFVPLPFVHMEAPIYLKGGARKGPTWREALLMHAIARLVLHPHITNIQTSWVKMGPRGAQACLRGRRQRPRRHADERIDHPRRRRRLRPGAAAAGDGRADRRARPRALPAHDALRRSAGRARRGLVPRGAARAEPVNRAAAAPRARARSSRWCASDSAGVGRQPAITLTAVPGIPAIRRRRRPRAHPRRRARGGRAAAARAGDVLVVTHKIVSKAEGRYVALADVAPSPRARELAAATGKDAALVEVILSESREVLRLRPGLIIAEHRLGMVLANAGVDQSNVPPAATAPRVLLLPQDPDASSAALRDALQRALRRAARGGGQRQRRARLAQRRGRARDRRRRACRRCSTCAAGAISKAARSRSPRSGSPTRSPRRRSC